MDILVRKAEIGDFEAFKRIMDQVQELHVQWRPDIYKRNDELFSAETFREAVANDFFYVAETDGKVVGVIGLILRHVENPSHVTRDIVYVDSMAVDEAFRGMGVGHALLDKAKEIAEEKHCQGVELQVNARNKQAYEMYTKYGFTEKSINLELL